MSKLNRNIANNNNSQIPGRSYGNVILIHQTATTASSSSLPSFQNQHETAAAATVSALPQRDGNTQEAEAENLRNLKPSSRKMSLVSSIYAYFGKLLHGTKIEQFRGDTASDTAKNSQQSVWWRLKLTVRRRQQDKKRNQKFLWCFRPVGAAADAAFENKSNTWRWTPFEKRNQAKLTEQYEKLPTERRTNDCCELRDKKINSGKVVVTVMLTERIAFVLDPEWSEPMTFEVQRFPKLTLYQTLRQRHDYKRWHKRQQQNAYYQNRPM